MAGVGIEIDSTDLAELGEKLDRRARRLSDLTPLLDEIGGALVAATQQRFEAGQAPDGTPWERSRRAIYEGGQTLRDSGRLEQSITHRVSADRVAVGTNVIYAAVHQFGATIRPKAANALMFKTPGGGFAQVQSVTIPARPFLGMSQGDRAEVGAIVEDFLRVEVGR